MRMVELIVTNYDDHDDDDHDNSQYKYEGIVSNHTHLG